MSDILIRFNPLMGVINIFGGDGLWTFFNLIIGLY